MYIPNEDTQNIPFCKLQLVVETFGTLNLMNQPIKIQGKYHKLIG